MKTLLVNGSPHAKGCTYTALCEVAAALEREGIETEIFQVGTKPISGCLGCGACLKTGRCVIADTVNEFLDKAEKADAFVFGSPVHFASASGMLTSFMDRAFYGRGNLFAYKPAAAVMSCRRGGATATFEQINKYFTISNIDISVSIGHITVLAIRTYYSLFCQTAIPTNGKLYCRFIHLIYNINRF